MNWLTRFWNWLTDTKRYLHCWECRKTTEHRHSHNFFLKRCKACSNLNMGQLRRRRKAGVQI